MSRSVLPTSSCSISRFGFGDSAGIMERKKPILAVVNPYDVLALVAALSLPAWRLFVGSKGSIRQNFSIFLFTDHHGSF